MARRKLNERDVRKLSKTKRGSYTITLPIEAMRDLRWRDKQKLTVRRSGSKIIIEDWKK